MRRRTRVFAFVSGPVDTAVFTASRLSGNRIGGYYDYDAGEFVATTKGIIALCEGLKGSSVTSLECAANLQVFAFLSAPTDTKANTFPLPFLFLCTLPPASESEHVFLPEHIPSFWPA